jgi:hypothetical protein
VKYSINFAPSTNELKIIDFTSPSLNMDHLNVYIEIIRNADNNDYQNDHDIDNNHYDFHDYSENNEIAIRYSVRTHGIVHTEPDTCKKISFYKMDGTNDDYILSE